MPDFSFAVVSNSSLGLTPNDITMGSVTIGAIQIMTVTDDDGVFDDEGFGGGQTRDLSSQVLATGIGGASAGQVVQSVYENTITNTTTGQTGTAHLIRIYNGTNPSSPGGQFGEYFWSFTIPISPGDTITQSGANFVGQEPYSNLFICFTSGTMITTDKGERRIEQLQTGDLVETADHGLQPIRWIGSSICEAKGDLAPVLIRKGALDNKQDLQVSPQHRMVLSGLYAELLFESTEVLATAKSLINDHTILRQEGGVVEYYHILFDTHEIIYAEGAKSESFHPGEQGWKALDEATRDEIIGLFPALAKGNFASFGPSARMSLRHNEGTLLGQYVVQ